MRNGPRDTESPKSPGTYLLPMAAHAVLVHTRDELRLLSQLSEPRGEDDRDEIVLSTEALSDCFSRIAEQLDETLGAMTRASSVN